MSHVCDCPRFSFNFENLTLDNRAILAYNTRGVQILFFRKFFNSDFPFSAKFTMFLILSNFSDFRYFLIFEILRMISVSKFSLRSSYSQEILRT